MIRTRRFCGLVVAVVFAGVLAGVAPNPVSAEAPPDARVFVSSSSAGSVDGVQFASGDIVVFDSDSDTWAMFFDGSQAGLGSANIDGLNVVDSSPAASVVELSFAGVTNVPGVGLVDDSDLVTFTGTTGVSTAGTFEILFDGSDVGLSSGGEDVDALTVDGSGYVLSTLGSGSVPGAGNSNLAVRDEDLVSFSGTTGAVTTGQFATRFDGSDVGLGGDVVSAWIDTATSQIYGSILGNYSIGGLSGDGDDVFVFTGTTGSTTSGTFGLFFDGDQHRFGGEQIDALHIELGTPTSPGAADLAVTVTVGTAVAIPGDTVAYTVDVFNNGPDPAANVIVAGPVPAGLTFTSTTGCPLDPNGLPCRLGTIAPGETASFTVSSLVDADTLGTITVSAEATGSTADPVPGNNIDNASLQVSGPPVAAADGPGSSSTPGSLFHTGTDTAYTLNAPAVLANDTLGDPPSVITSFGGGDLGGSVADNPAGQPVTVATDGSLRVDADGSLAFTPSTGSSGLFTFSYRLANSGGFSDAEVSIYVGPRPVAAGNLIYLTSAGSGTVDGLAFDDEDIIVYNTVTDTWAMFIDGSDLGLELADINGFTIETLEPTPVVHLTFVAPTVVPGIAGRVDDSDIATLTTTTTGDTTTGTFQLLFDGSDVGLSSGGEDIDALAAIESDLVMSTWGSHNAGGVAGPDEDLLTFTPSATGSTTTGTFARLFDGSDVGLGSEDIWATDINGETGDIYGSSFNGFSVPGLSGDGDDIFVFTPTSTGSTTAGTFSIFFDGDTARYGGNQINGLHIIPAPISPTNRAPSITTVGPVQVDENQTGAVDVDATDPDGETENGGGLGYSFAGGVDDGLFDLDAATGVVTFKVAPDFEVPGDGGGDNDYDIRVTVTDGGGLTDTVDLVVTVEDVVENRAPSITTVGPVLVDENQTGAVDVDAIDPDGETENGGGLGYSFAGGVDDGLFDLDAASGVVTFKVAPDFEVPGDGGGDNDYDIRVTVTDGGELTDTVDLVVTVQDVAESVGFAVGFGGNQGSADEGRDVAVDSSGNVFGVGLFWGTADFDPDPDATLIHTSVGNWNAYLAKYTTAGQLAWAHSFGSSNDVGRAVAVDGSGNSFITGSFGNTTDFDPDPNNTVELVADGNGDTFIASFDPTGDLRWARSVGGSSSDSGADITVDSSGNVFVVGTFAGTADFDPSPDATANLTAGGSSDAFLLKLDGNGNFEWVRQYNSGSGFDLAGGVGVDSAGNAYIGGVWSSSATQSSADFFLVKVDPEGNQLWSNTFTRSSSYAEVSLDVDPAGNSYITGDFSGTTDFDPGPGTAPLSGGSFVAKYDSDGSYVWANAFSAGFGGSSRAIGVNAVGESIVTGRFRGPIDVDPSSESFVIESGDFSSVFLIKLGADGDLVWAKAIDGPGADIGNGATVDASGNVFSTGEFQTSISVPTGGSITHLTSNGTSDAFIAKLSARAPAIGTPTSISVLENSSAVADIDALDDDDSEVSGLTYDLSGGPDVSLFQIDSGTGELVFDTAPDYEDPSDSDFDNVYEVDVRVTDSTGLFHTVSMTIVVTNDNEDPVITTVGPVLVDENQTGAVDVDAIDPDGETENGGGLGYSFAGGVDDGLFDLDAASGVVTFKVAPDFEAPGDGGGDNDHDIRVTVTDGSGLTDTVDLVITVEDLSEFAAIADSYESLGNVGIEVPATGGLLANDISVGAPALVTEVQADAANVGAIASTDEGGVVVVSPSGAFVYTPPPGFEGPDTFSYSSSDGQSIDQASVTINVDDVIWFIDSSNTSGIEFGTLDFPFGTIDDSTGFASAAPDEPADVIYVAGSTNYPGTLSLQTGQVVVGEGSSSSIEGVAGLTVPTFSRPLPQPTGTTSPGIAGSPGIILASDNTVQGVDLTATSGFRMIGANPGTVTASEMTIGVGNGRSVALEVTGSSSSSINLSGVSLVDNTATQGQEALSIVAKDSSTVDVTLSDLGLASSNGTAGVLLLGSDTARMTYRVNGSTLSAASDEWTLRASAAGSSDLDGEVNTSSVSSSAAPAAPLQFAADGSGSNVVAATGNMVTGQTALSGIALGTTSLGLANVQATLVDNTIDIGGAVNFGIGMTGRGPGHTICLDARQNNVSGADGFAFAIAADDPVVLEGLAGNVAALAQNVPLLNSWWTAQGNSNTTPDTSIIGNRDLDAVGRAVVGSCANPSLQN